MIFNEICLPQPYLLFLGNADDAVMAKTATGLRDWAGAKCLGEYACPGAPITVGLPFVTPQAAFKLGAKSLVIGVAPAGGSIAPSWIPILISALEAGLDLVSGMHYPLDETPEIKAAASRLGRQLIDVRRPPQRIPVATGRRRWGRRLLTVGTDCAVGKKYTALTLTQAFKAKGIKATFRATGQTGILIAGRGIPIDAVISDFVAGAAELLSPDADPLHWDVIEGQGSLFHPSYAGVSLGLLHGSQPDLIVLCHDAGRRTMHGLDTSFPLPTPEEAIELNLMLARRVNPDVKCAGVSLNTSSLGEEEAYSFLAAESARLGIACVDPMRSGGQFEQLVAACLS